MSHNIYYVKLLTISVTSGDWHDINCMHLRPLLPFEHVVFNLEGKLNIFIADQVKFVRHSKTDSPANSIIHLERYISDGSELYWQYPFLRSVKEILVQDCHFQTVRNNDKNV